MVTHKPEALPREAVGYFIIVKRDRKPLCAVQYRSHGRPLLSSEYFCRHRCCTIGSSWPSEAEKPPRGTRAGSPPPWRSGHISIQCFALLILSQVSDLQTVLSVVQKILENLLLCNQFQDPVFNRCLAATIERAFNTLNEVNGVIESGLIRNPEQMPNRRVKISWKIWLRNHGYLSSVSSRLRDVKVELASVLTLLTA